jgi:hypothetical protein
MEHIAHAQLPKTGYIVSLLLWAMEQKQRFERINEALLLEHIIEFLLEKTDLSGLLRREFGFRAKEIVLRHIARFLRDAGGLAPTNKLLVSLATFFQEKGLNFSADDVIRSFVECGILVKNDENTKFKYRCFQEYFIAGRLREDRAYLTSTLQAETFLSFRRELELMSGLSQQCDEVLEFLEATLKRIQPQSLAGQELGSFSRLSVGEHAVVVAGLRQREITKVEISEEQIDDLWDYAEEKWSAPHQFEAVDDAALTDEDKEARDAAIQLFSYIAGVDLYGRVLKNLEFADKRSKIIHLKSFLSEWTRITLYLMNEMEKSLREVVEAKIGDFADMDQKRLNDLDYRLSTLAPILASLVIDSEVGTEKLIPIIEEISDSADSPDLVAFFCSALLLELKAGSWETKWRRLRDKMASKGNRLAISVLIERLWVFYRMHPLGRQQRTILANLIGDLRISLGMHPREKPALISQIEKRGIIRDAQDF